MIRTGRITKKQRKIIEDLFYEKRYKQRTDVVNDLVKIGLKHIDEFDTFSDNSELERDGMYFNFDKKIIKGIKSLERKKGMIPSVIIRRLIGIGINYKEEL